MDTNFVLAGKYEGGVIKTDKNNKVYVEHTTKTASGYSFDSKWYFDKTNVTSIEKINEDSSSFKTSASYWLGSVAAAGLSDVKDVILQIAWRDNTESIIKVREGIYTQILATKMSDVPDAVHLKTEEETDQKRAKEYIANEFKAIQEKLRKAMNLYFSKDIDDILTMAEMFDQIHISITDNVIISNYLLITDGLSAEEKFQQKMLIDTKKKCENILKDFDGVNNKIAAEKHIKYNSIESIDYSIDGVLKIVSVYQELGDFRDSKKRLADIGDCNDPVNIDKYIKYRKLVDKYNAPTTREEFEATRQVLESMGDYLDAQYLSDKKESKEWADSYFAAFSNESASPQATPTAPVENKKSGCYVATCVYGSYNCPEVWTLRRFRDNTLGSTWCGRAFIRTYYAISPMIVKWFGNTAWFKKMWRGTLDRMVKKLEANGVENTPYEDKKW